ncbi:hypothetical protein [Gracilibacillus saliphilus]|uniref:hypothetical protein n=1 Tax=Gracilibacillus saliphilus TaxID=543890 RepID=UPI0013D5C140|nr:hypothetical protein [Gracilibacillus saliphilus]
MKTSKTINVIQLLTDDKGDEKEQEVEFTIRKIPIGRFADLMLGVDKLPSIVKDNVTAEELSNINEEVIFTKLPKLVASSQDEILQLVSIASGIDKSNIEKLDFEGFFDVITAVIELNNVNAIVEKVKNLGKVFQKKK